MNLWFMFDVANNNIGGHSPMQWFPLIKSLRLLLCYRLLWFIPGPLITLPVGSSVEILISTRLRSTPFSASTQLELTCDDLLGKMKWRGWPLTSSHLMSILCNFSTHCSALHNAQIVQKDPPVSKNALYLLHRDSSIHMYFDRNFGKKRQNPVADTRV